VNRKIEKGDVWLFLLDASERRCNGVGDTYYDYAINGAKLRAKPIAIKTCVADDDDT
jgi:hypothetical protein